jgi:phage-related minor tail protein
MSTNTDLSSFDVHNELSPILDTIEALLEVCGDIALGTSPAAKRVAALWEAIVDKTAVLRTSLDEMCGVPPRAATEEVRP